MHVLLIVIVIYYVCYVCITVYCERIPHALLTRCPQERTEREPRPGTRTEILRRVQQDSDLYVTLH